MALVQALYCGSLNISMHLEAFLFNPLVSHCIPLHGQSIIYLIVSYLGTSNGQGGLVSCDSWGCKESDTTERLN